LQLLCLAMCGLALLASLVIITLVWQRLVQHGLGPAAAVPTLFIVLGPVGQSMTAAHTLGASAALTLPVSAAGVARVLGVAYAAPMWGFAMLWLTLAVAMVVRTARRGLPFSLTWWSFTFPVGTVVTGTSGLAVATGATFFAVVAVLLYAGLVCAWLLTSARTLHGVGTAALLVPTR